MRFCGSASKRWEGPTPLNLYYMLLPCSCFPQDACRIDLAPGQALAGQPVSPSARPSSSFKLCPWLIRLLSHPLLSHSWQPVLRFAPWPPSHLLPQPSSSWSAWQQPADLLHAASPVWALLRHPRRLTRSFDSTAAGVCASGSQPLQAALQIYFHSLLWLRTRGTGQLTASAPR